MTERVLIAARVGVATALAVAVLGAIWTEGDDTPAEQQETPVETSAKFSSDLLGTDTGRV